MSETDHRTRSFQTGIPHDELVGFIDLLDRGHVWQQAKPQLCIGSGPDMLHVSLAQDLDLYVSFIETMIRGLLDDYGWIAAGFEDPSERYLYGTLALPSPEQGRFSPKVRDVVRAWLESPLAHQKDHRYGLIIVPGIVTAPSCILACTQPDDELLIDTASKLPFNAWIWDIEQACC
jgi:hypothetical protein